MIQRSYFKQIIIFNAFTNTNEMSHFKDNIINLLMKKNVVNSINT